MILVIGDFVANTHGIFHEQCENFGSNSNECRECCETELEYMSSRYNNDTQTTNPSQSDKCECLEDWDWDIGDCFHQHESLDECTTCCKQYGRDHYSHKMELICICTSQNYENQIAAGVRDRIKPESFEG